MTIGETSPRYIARCSWGNDSVAMLRLLANHRLKDVAVVYSNTGWAAPEWADRVEQGAAWVRSLGWEHVELPSIGFEQLVLSHTSEGMFPNRWRKFCTVELKIKPFIEWVKQADPERRAVICVGVRRAESKARSRAPAFMPEQDDGRHVWQPLVEVTDECRNELVEAAGFEVLPHRSKECGLCIHANRQDLRAAPAGHIAVVRRLEATVKRPMFRPENFMGASGIDEVLDWAGSEPGKFRPRQEADAGPLFLNSGDEIGNEPEGTCVDGWCGA